MPTLSVVVPATDSPATLARCRAAIEAAADSPDEVVVVERPAELSAAAARNLGVQRTSGDVVVFVDADVEVHPDAFVRIRAAFAGDADLDAIFGSYDDAPGAKSAVSTFRNLLHHHIHQTSSGSAETFWTGLGAVRRATFLAVGGFDEVRFPHPSIEDIELGSRLAAAGAGIRLDPTILGKHLKVWTLRTMLWTDFARRGIPWVALQLQAGRPSTALNCGWRHRVSAAAWVVAPAGALAGLGSTVALSGVALLVLNHSFYTLLVRRQGLGQAVVGFGLHGLHHLVSVAAVLAGVLVWVVSATASSLTRSPSGDCRSSGETLRS